MRELSVEDHPEIIFKKRLYETKGREEESGRQHEAEGTREREDGSYETDSLPKTTTDGLSDTDVLEDGREVAEAVSATACLHAIVLAFAPGSPSLLTAPEMAVAVAVVLVSRSALGYRHNDGIGGLRVNVNALETAAFVDTFS
jgi:hypothetical protein